MLEVIFTLIMLILLQAVLGFDNLLYISLESKKAPTANQKKVRKTGIDTEAIKIRAPLYKYFADKKATKINTKNGIIAFVIIRLYMPIIAHKYFRS